MTKILCGLLAGIACLLGLPRTLSAEKLLDLHLVAQQGSGKEMQEELASGIALNLSDENGRTALLHSVLYGNLVTARVLLAAGADPEVQDNLGIAPFVAIRQGDIE